MVKINLRNFIRQVEIDTGKDISLREISRQTGIGLATLVRMNTGKTERTSLDVLNKLCSYFNLPPGPVPFVVYEPD